MKKIGIDARLYSQTGVGTYLKNLIYYLDKDYEGRDKFYIYLMDDDYDRTKFTNNNLVKRRANFRWHTLGEQTGFLKILASDNLDLMHFTYFSYPIFYPGRFIATVHDVTPLLFKTGRASTRNPLIYIIKHFFFKLILKTQIMRAKKIITPTQVVRDQLIDIYGQSIAYKSEAVLEGVSHQIISVRENKKLTTKYKDFFIYVGNFYPHKNVENLITAFKSAKTGLKLLLIGPDDYFTQRLKLSLNNDRRITLVKNPPVADLVFFYKNARALIHPSLSEGFGLPLIEAAYFNCPIIASDIPVFRELLGRQYLAFDPHNPAEIAAKIEFFVIKSPKFNYTSLLNRFSFRKMTDTTLKIYSEFSS